jgi:hypothetical protein
MTLAVGLWQSPYNFSISNFCSEHAQVFKYKLLPSVDISTKLFMVLVYESYKQPWKHPNAWRHLFLSIKCVVTFSNIHVDADYMNMVYI